MKSFLFLAHTFFLATLLTSSPVQGGEDDGKTLNELKKLFKEKTEEKNFIGFWEKAWEALEKELQRQEKPLVKTFLAPKIGKLIEKDPENLKPCLLSLVSFYHENQTPTLKEFVDSLIPRHSFIPPKLSKEILCEIQCLCEPEEFEKNLKKKLEKIKNNKKETLSFSINFEQLEKLRKSYQEKTKEVADLPEEVFDLMIKDKYPQLKDYKFSWEKTGNPIFDSAPALKFGGILFPHPRPSLLSLLLDDFIFEEKKVVDFCQLLLSIHALSAKDEISPQLKEWLKVAFQGETVTLVSVVCPDYATEEDTNGNRCYTFQGVNSGIGIVARRFLDVLPKLISFFHEYQMKVNIKVALGDFEAFSATILERVGLAEEGFLERLRGSQQAIQEKVQHIIQENRPQGIVTSEVGFFTEWHGGRKHFEEMCQNFKSSFEEDEYKHSDLNNTKLLKIVQARQPLYDRWYGEKSSLEEYIALLKAQGAEYAAMGELIRTYNENCFVLAADHDAMELFWHTGGPINLLYLRNLSY